MKKVETKKHDHYFNYFMICVMLIGFIMIGRISYSKPKEEPKKIIPQKRILNEDNVFIKANANDILREINNGNLLAILGVSNSKNCEYYANIVNDVAKELGIEQIMYYDFFEDRKNSNGTYQTIVNSLSNYIKKDDLGNLNLFGPTFIIIKDGNILFYDDDNRINGSLTEEEYWNVYNTNMKYQYFKTALLNYLGE